MRIPRVEDSVERSPRRKSPVWTASPGTARFPRDAGGFESGESIVSDERARTEARARDASANKRESSGVARAAPYASRFRAARRTHASVARARVRVLPSRGRSASRPDRASRATFPRCQLPRCIPRDRRLAGTPRCTGFSDLRSPVGRRSAGRSAKRFRVFGIGRFVNPESAISGSRRQLIILGVPLQQFLCRRGNRFLVFSLREGFSADKKKCTSLFIGTSQNAL